MLKGKGGVSACSLSSCRIRAETLARAFNSRLWPCAWASNNSSAEREDGMSNGIDDDDQFFDASPSPVEIEDQPACCQQHSSAATEEGRAKLYELLQQHATDDAIDVFYDVREDADLTGSSNDMCLKDDMKDTVQVDNFCESSICCEIVGNKFNITMGEDGSEKADGGMINELKFSNVSQSNDSSINVNVQADVESPQSEFEIRSDSQVVLDQSISCAFSNAFDGQGGNTKLDSNKITQSFIREDKIVLEDKSISCIEEKEISSLADVAHLIIIKDIIDDKRPEDSEENMPKDTTQVFSLSSEVKTVNPEENFINANPESSDNASKLFSDNKNLEIDKANEISIELTETNSSSPTSDTNVSPTSSRLQVFDEPRPKISRTTSLKTGKTPPGTPSRKKIVRFADVLGLDLEDVRHILAGDVPTIPSSAYTDLDLKGTDLHSCNPISETIEIRNRILPCWSNLLNATATNVLYPEFAIPGEQADFLDRVRHQGICLETLVVSDMSIQCTCRVMNYGFHKKVIARYTINNWLSTDDIDALYVQGSSNSETDIFSFSIFLSPANRNLKFALKYSVNGREYWDNNRGQDYCLNYHGNDSMQNVSSYSHASFGESWQHQFW